MLDDVVAGVYGLAVLTVIGLVDPMSLWKKTEKPESSDGKTRGQGNREAGTSGRRGGVDTERTGHRLPVSARAPPFRAEKLQSGEAV